MHEITIKAEYVNPPDKNPDYGSIKAGGKYWSIPASMLSQFEAGKTYTIGYTTSEGKTGKTFYNVKELRSSAAPSIGHNSAPTQPHTNSNRDPDYDLKVGAQAKFNSVAPSLVDISVAKGIKIDETWIATLYAKCVVGHARGWEMAQEMLRPKVAAPKPPPQEPPFNDDIEF